MKEIVAAKDNLINCQNALERFLYSIITEKTLPDEEVLKSRAEYFKWIEIKTNIIDNENSFALPYNVIPNKISEYVYNYLHMEKREVVRKYYEKDNKTGSLIISVKKNNIPLKDLELLVHSLTLRRGNVIWVNFGFNIGREFRGKHPALILKNAKDTIIALPLSSQLPINLAINVEIDTVYGLPLIKRWGNILRITPVSIMRIDFDSPVGSVKNAVLREISDKVKEYGVK